MAPSHSKDGPRPNGKIAVVTGVNGYIASVLGHDLLAKGYKVRGTVRSRASGQALADGAYRSFGSQFEVVQVPDITAPHAFDEAVKGEWRIYHVASPVNLSLTKVEEVVHVAVEATKNVLQTAHDHAGQQLEALVVTSSVAALLNMTEGQLATSHVYTEADWNEKSEKQLAQPGSQLDPGQLYVASKVAAERTVWSWREDHKPSFSISSVLPSLVIGTPAQLPATPDGLNLSLQPTWGVFAGENLTLQDLIPITAVVHVRDVSTIHIWCGEYPRDSDGHRFIASAAYCSAQATADILRKHYPARRGIIPEGHPGQGYQSDFSKPPHQLGFDGTKAARAVGLTYLPVEQMIVDTAKAMEKYL
ncbi:MAG: hypothetical protein M1826_004292 [Phylliscum demangeonii]|nr:MAG: hypothetical protein M1826_004292 [Phylliscum demangeonii]